MCCLWQVCFILSCICIFSQPSGSQSLPGLGASTRSCVNKQCVMLPKTWGHRQRFLPTSRLHHSLSRKHFQSDWKWSKNTVLCKHTNRADRCKHDNTQTRPITGRITATGAAGRGVCLARLANRNRPGCLTVRCYLLIVCNSVSNSQDGL